jgi:hypothetical protein
MVSPPPSGGMVWLYSMLPQGGMGARDWSLCQLSPEMRCEVT